MSATLSRPKYNLHVSVREVTKKKHQPNQNSCSKTPRFHSLVMVYGSPRPSSQHLSVLSCSPTLQNKRVFPL